MLHESYTVDTRSRNFHKKLKQVDLQKKVARLVCFLSCASFFLYKTLGPNRLTVTVEMLWRVRGYYRNALNYLLTYLLTSGLVNTMQVTRI